MRKNKGFTLIELLVVIAIIGILSSVVLASLNSARNKGSDAAVKSAMSSFQAQAALYYDGAGAQSFNTSAGTTNTCNATGTVFSDPQGINIINNVIQNASTIVPPKCYASSTAYVVIAQLKSNLTYWCVDSAGNSTTSSAVNAATGLCI